MGSCRASAMAPASLTSAALRLPPWPPSWLALWLPPGRRHCCSIDGGCCGRRPAREKNRPKQWLVNFHAD